MEKKDFYEYAKECNKVLSGKDEDVEKIRDNRLKSASAKLIEIASFIKDNGTWAMTFEICLNKKFKQYEYNWASIRINNCNMFIFIVDSQEQRDVIFQIYKRLNILIFDKDVKMDFVGSEIIRKMQEANRTQIKKQNKTERKNGK